MNLPSYTSAAILWGLMAIPTFAQNVVIFSETGAMMEGPMETDLLTVELPMREWVTTDAEVEEKSWVFAAAEEPEIERVAAPEPTQVFAEAKEIAPVFAGAEVHLEEAEAPAPRIDVAVEPPTAVRRKPRTMEDLIEQGKVLRLYAIQFDYDKATLRSEAMPTIRQIAEALKRAPALSIFVEGHTDARGSVAYNLDLSRRRAAAVVDALVNIHGIDRSRLTPLGIGEDRLLDFNNNEAAHQQNRRVEIRNRAG